MIYSLQHIGRTVPDLEVGRQLYTCFGMSGEERGDDLVFRCDARDQDQIRLIEGARKKLRYISLGTDLGGLAGIKQRLQKEGIELRDDPFGLALGGIWFMDPIGDWINVQVAEPAVSTAPAALEFNAPVLFRRIDIRA